MKSRAGEVIGQGWAFGLHEAMDQTGALAGPLITALVLAHHGNYQSAFLWLAIPATLTVLTAVVLSARYSYAGNIAPAASGAAESSTLPRAFWLYAASGAMTAFGFADYPLIAYHFAQAHVMSAPLVPILYAVAMGMSGAGSLVFGRWFDARGLSVLIPGLAVTAAAAPLVFLGSFDLALVGAIVWGLALGIHDAIMNAAVATIVPATSRARAYGYFTAIYGIAWFAGSALMGAIYDQSLTALVIVSVVAQALALVPLIGGLRAMRSA
jgi:MFS family permease